MEEQQVFAIRESTRNLLKLNRRYQRDEETDGRRCVEENSHITSDTIAEIANRLKTKSSISTKELQMLKNGLMEDPKYIEVVLNTHGALRGLIREISGTDVHKQCGAAGCLCNLALGDARAGSTVAKAAGSYLVAALNSLSNELAVTCAWTIGNLAGSGTKACNILVAQGALSKLCDLLNCTCEEMQDAALYAVMHFAYQMKDELGIEHLNNILHCVYKKLNTKESMQLLFILSCHKDFSIKEESVLQIVQNLPVSIENYLKNNNCYELKYLIRILANISVNEFVYNLYVNFLTQYLDSFKLLLKTDDLNECLLWLLGNLFNYRSDNLLFIELFK